MESTTTTTKILDIQLTKKKHSRERRKKTKNKNRYANVQNVKIFTVIDNQNGMVKKRFDRNSTQSNVCSKYTSILDTLYRMHAISTDTILSKLKLMRQKRYRLLSLNRAYFFLSVE